VDRRYSLASVLVILVAGAIYLWLHPEQQAPAPLPSATPTTTTADTAQPAAPRRAAANGHYVLAISWEPAFCEGTGGKPECRSQSAGRPDASRFSLHGLWPDDQYCGVSSVDESADKNGDWDSLPRVNLSAATQADLDRAMPGTQSRLERHEWLKHGTCSGVSADTYFSRAVLFLDTINNSAVGTLFGSRIGNRLDGAAIRNAFDTAFGAGAGDRIRIACSQDGDRRLISEITVGLRGDVLGEGGIGELIAASRPTDPGCNGGIVDRVGRD
jgi:ribonuclease T2